MKLTCASISKPSKALSFLFIFFFTAVGVICYAPSTAQGNLLITPKRVVFDGSKRSEDLNLANIGKDTATYVVSFVQIRMKEDGSFENIVTPDSGQFFADKNLRIFPRTVTLPPGEAQTIKVQLTKKNELVPGEYRSHLYFRAVQNDMPLGSEAVKNDTTVSVKLVPIFGISIPAIIRIGETTSVVKVSDVSFDVEQDTLPILSMIFHRTGNMSVYGDISIDHISPYAVKTRVADAKGVAIYTPNTKRKLRFKLNRGAGADFSSGRLVITYTEESPKNKVLVKEEYNLN